MTPTTTDSAREGTPSSARDPGPASTAAQRAEAWHRQHDAEHAKAVQKREVELAERREAHRERGKRCEAAVVRAIESHEEKRMDLHKAEVEVERLRRERDHLPDDLHRRMNEWVEAAARRVHDRFARTVDTLPGMMPRLGSEWVADWLIAHDPRVRETWHATVAEATAASPSYSDRSKKEIEKDLDGAKKEVEQTHEFERSAYTALGTARRELYEWSAGR